MSEVVGIDLGGTKVAGGRLCDGQLDDSLVEHTSRSSTTALIDQLVELVERLGSGEVSAVVIGVPSVVEFETGRVVSSVNVPLADLPLRQLLTTRLGCPVFLDNDATVAALAEAHDEQLRLVAHNLVMLTVGTGVDGGLVLGGRIYRGATGGAGALGHTIVGLDRSDRAGPGAVGVPPAQLTRVRRRRSRVRPAGRARGEPYPGSVLGRLRLAGGQVLGADAVQAAHEADRRPRRPSKSGPSTSASGSPTRINTFDPGEVVIGGGGALAGELVLHPATRAARWYALPGLGSRTTIRLARHGVRAGVIGAALPATHELDEP
ncbi:MAG: ROK family protein [Blastococcus sp.]